MNFVSLEFALFFLVVLSIGALFQPGGRTQKRILLCCNLFFYATAGLFFLPLLLGVAVLDWGTGILVYRYPDRPKIRKIILGTDITLHILILAFFKYYEFFVLNVEAFCSALGMPAGMLSTALPVTDLLFPVGLSFYTFQGLSYAIDQYRTPELVPQPFFSILSFISFFPTLLAGPILRAHQFLPQWNKPLYSKAAIREGFTLILSGLFKKVVLASYLSEHIVRDVFLTPDYYSSWTVLFAVYGYTIQIFCDFSGYSDMAVGVGKLMGYSLPKNFNSPYLALNLQDFWRRWHITLSLWLRDYLYIPLGGSKRGNRSLNLIITMGLGGLWHGSHLRFLIWGLLHGLGLAVVHGFQILKQKYPLPVRFTNSRWASALGVGLSWLLTFHFVAFLWIFFRAEDMERSLEILRRIFCFGFAGEGFPVLVIPAILSGLLVQYFGRRIRLSFLVLQKKLPFPVQAIVLAFLGGLILKMGPDGVMPFIYFQF